MQENEMNKIVANLKVFMKTNHIKAIVADFTDHTDYHSIAQGWGFSCGDGIDSSLYLELDDDTIYTLASGEDSPASFSINNQAPSL